jgi:hypothetical protein
MVMSVTDGCYHGTPFRRHDDWATKEVRRLVGATDYDIEVAWWFDGLMISSDGLTTKVLRLMPRWHNGLFFSFSLTVLCNTHKLSTFTDSMFLFLSCMAVPFPFLFSSFFGSI